MRLCVARAPAVIAANERLRLSDSSKFSWSPRRNVLLCGQSGRSWPRPSRPTTIAANPSRRSWAVSPRTPLSNMVASDFDAIRVWSKSAELLAAHNERVRSQMGIGKGRKLPDVNDLCTGPQPGHLLPAVPGIAQDSPDRRRQPGHQGGVRNPGIAAAASFSQQKTVVECDPLPVVWGEGIVAGPPCMTH